MNGHVFDTLIPITLFLVTGVVIVTTLVLRFQKRKVESQEILAAIEKGVEVKFPEQGGKSRLLPGLIWTLVGIVVTIALAASVTADIHEGGWVWGLVPVAVGAANLIVYKLEIKNDQDNAE